MLNFSTLLLITEKLTNEISKHRMTSTLLLFMKTMQICMMSKKSYFQTMNCFFAIFPFYSHCAYTNLQNGLVDSSEERGER